IDERAHPGRQIAALADIDRMNLLGIPGIMRLEQRHQPARLNVWPDMEPGEPRQPDSGEREAARGLAVADLDVARGRNGRDGAARPEGPFLETAGEVEADAVVALQIREPPGRTVTRDIGRCRDHRHAAFADLAADEARGCERAGADGDIGALFQEID